MLFDTECLSMAKAGLLLSLKQGGSTDFLIPKHTCDDNASPGSCCAASYDQQQAMQLLPGLLIVHPDFPRKPPLLCQRHLQPFAGLLEAPEYPRLDQVSLKPASAVSDSHEVNS